MKKIILASGSPRRRELLTQIGISFEVVKAEGEEKITTDDPEEAVKELAMQKAQEVAGRVDADVVIGADTVVAVDGEIMGKPKDPEDAVRMIHRIQGCDPEKRRGGDHHQFCRDYPCACVSYDRGGDPVICSKQRTHG